MRDGAASPQRVASQIEHVDEVEADACEYAELQPAGDERASDYCGAGGICEIFSAPSAELIPISPCCHFWPQRIADPYELEPFTHACEADVIGRHSQLRAAKQSLALLDRFPSFFERCEVPARARLAYDPESSLLSIECQAASNGKMLDYFVRAKIAMTEEAG